MRRDKHLLQLHNTRISFGMFTAVALFFPAHPPFFQSHQTYAFLFSPVPDWCGLVWFQHRSRLQGGVWKSGRQCPERGREWRLRLGSDKEGKSEERLLAWVSGLSYGEGGKEWLCPPSSSAPARLERCSNPVKTKRNMFADFFF